MVEELVEPLVGVLKALGSALRSNPYILVFVVSLIGNSVPYVSVPYYIFLIIYSGIVRDPLELVAIATVSGLGSTLGKLVIYMIGRGVSKIVSERDRENIELFGRLIGRWGFIFLVVAASTPIPDDVVLIPIAFAGYSVAQYFLAVLIGKVIISLIIVFFGRGLVGFAESVGVPQYIQIPVLLAVSVILMIIIMRINWGRVVKEYEAGGIQGALNEIYRSVVAMVGGRRNSSRYGEDRVN